mmetsp:Transcript_10565/g.25869  ORF Transcript_10565/g.25869 Transcript_10565/m.25869 type:complete len:293 (-) Transcript_10565:339-1217(-)
MSVRMGAPAAQHSSSSVAHARAALGPKKFPHTLTTAGLASMARMPAASAHSPASLMLLQVRSSSTSVPAAAGSAAATACAPRSASALPLRLMDRSAALSVRMRATDAPPTSLILLHRRSSTSRVSLAHTPYAASVSTPKSRTAHLPSLSTRRPEFTASMRATCPTCSSCTVVSRGFSRLMACSVPLPSLSAAATDTRLFMPSSQSPRSRSSSVLLVRSISASAIPPASPMGLPRRFSTASPPPPPPGSARQSASLAAPSGPMLLPARLSALSVRLTLSRRAMVCTPASSMLL